MPSEWDKRIRRASDLLKRNPSSSQVLAFYGHVLAFQEQVRQELESQGPSSEYPVSVPFREQLDVEFAVRWIPRLLDTVQREGPAQLAREAERIRGADATCQREVLVEFLQADPPSSDVPASFFARILLQPCAEFLASQRELPAVYSASLCPLCGSMPQLAVLHPEGDGGKRHLVCSLCLTEWEFRRIICPVCEEMDPTKLPRYSAEDPMAVRVDACDTCKSYLKSFDMTLDGHLVPEVDEIATVPLDLWAVEHGYHKIQLNLLGF